MKLGLVLAAVALVAGSTAAAGQTVEYNVQVGFSDITYVQELGSSQPVTINQTSQYNYADVLQINHGGSTSATITQTGTVNAAVLNQFGASNTGVIAQSGLSNSSLVFQGK